MEPKIAEWLLVAARDYHDEVCPRHAHSCADFITTLAKKFAERVPSSPAAPTPAQPTMADIAELESLISELRGQLNAANAAYVRGGDRAQVHYDDTGLPSTADIDRKGFAFSAADVSKAPCPSASPCGEMVAKGVCDIGPLAGNRVHEQDDYCLNWHVTIRVCLGCGREEPV